MTISTHEFILRFLLHVLPINFMKIRDFDFLPHRNKKAAINLIWSLIKPDAVFPEKTQKSIA